MKNNIQNADKSGHLSARFCCVEIYHVTVWTAYSVGDSGSFRNSREIHQTAANPTSV